MTRSGLTTALTTAGDLVAVAYAGWLLVGAPLAGARRVRPLALAVRAHSRLRLACYRASLRAVAVSAGVAGLALVLGRAAPPPPGLAGLPRPLLVALGLTSVVAVAVSRPVPALARPLLPVTPVERRLFRVVVLARAGGEELAYRALLPGVLLLVLPGVGTAGAVLVATAAFAATRCSQGRSGVARGAVAGLALASLYAGTGSLLAAVAGHVLLDLPIARLRGRSPARAPQVEHAAHPAAQRSVPTRPASRTASRVCADPLPAAAAAEARVARRA
ncbi:MAG TPA: CPBP family glutamic-type intramembrane protease [Mycobacteriales bacterium]|nr:CPBP family glutamic-type intramembrane protease [Mycobacteriales bacterium]